MIRRLLVLGVLVTVHGCHGEVLPPPSPAEQFKTLVDAKRADLKPFLESKKTKLSYSEANVKENPNVDQLKDHTHIGTFLFTYHPYGNFVDEVKAYYHFDSHSKKWRYFNADHTPGNPHLKQEEVLVTFPEVLEIVKKIP
jgi:hypothetical protein